MLHRNKYYFNNNNLLLLAVWWYNYYYIFLSTTTTSVVFAAQSSSSSSSVSLTKDTYEQLTQDKTVFIKWFAPWCGHCQELAPHWEKMAQEWINHPKGLVAQVDCTQEQTWCIQMGISAFPTLQYGEPSYKGSFLKEYNGEKTYEGLSQFAKETLTQSMCSPGNKGPCTNDEREQIDSYWIMSTNDLKIAIAEKEAQIDKAHKDFALEYRTMQNDYNIAARERQKIVAEAKHELKLLKQTKQMIIVDGEKQQ